jgi:cytochrome c oxidase assembly protein subunit 15
LTIHVLWLATRIWTLPTAGDALVWPGTLLAAALLLQLGLGAATWIVNYGWPSWLQDVEWAQSQVVLHRGLAQSMLTTMHVAVGSLILGTSVMIALRAFRLFSGQAEILPAPAQPAGALA